MACTRLKSKLNKSKTLTSEILQSTINESSLKRSTMKRTSSSSLWSSSSSKAGLKSTWITLAWIISVCWIVLAVLPPAQARGSLVQSQKALNVKNGRSVFLKREDLQVARTRRGEECRVEVVTTDPITQRVGLIDPPVS